MTSTSLRRFPGSTCQELHHGQRIVVAQLQAAAEVQGRQAADAAQCVQSSA